MFMLERTVSNRMGGNKGTMTYLLHLLPMMYILSISCLTSFNHVRFFSCSHLFLGKKKRSCCVKVSVSVGK